MSIITVPECDRCGISGRHVTFLGPFYLEPPKASEDDLTRIDLCEACAEAIIRMYIEERGNYTDQLNWFSRMLLNQQREDVG